MSVYSQRFTTQEKAEMSRMRDQGMTLDAIAGKFGTTRQSVWYHTRHYVSPRLKGVPGLSRMADSLNGLADHLAVDEVATFTKCSDCRRIDVRTSDDRTHGCMRCGGRPVQFAVAHGTGERI